MKTKILSAFFLLITLIGCKEETRNFDWGIVKNETYKNKFFDFTVPIPKNWTYDDKHSVYWAEKTNLISNEGVKSAYENGFLFTTNPGKIKETSLFLLKTPNNTDNNLSNIYFKVENAVQIDNATIKGIDDYLEYSLNDAKKNTSLKLDTEEYEKVNIGGQPFFKLSGVYLVENGTKVFQEYYLTLKKGFGFGVILSANSKKDIEKLQEALKNANF